MSSQGKFIEIAPGSQGTFWLGKPKRSVICASPLRATTQDLCVLEHICRQPRQNFTTSRTGALTNMQTEEEKANAGGSVEASCPGIILNKFEKINICVTFETETESFNNFSLIIYV